MEGPVSGQGDAWQCSATPIAFPSFPRYLSSSKDGSDKPSACPHGPLEGTSLHPLPLRCGGGRQGRGKAGPPQPEKLHCRE